MNLGRNSGFWDELYRYGFQNQEKDDEVKGEGNSVNYKYRMHSLYRLYGNPRLGRFFAVDPLIKDYPFYSSYSFSGNIVIHNIELEGLENVHYYLQNEQGEWTRVPNWVDVYSDLDENINCYLYTYPKGGVKKAVYKSIEQGGKDRWEHHGGTAPPELLRAHYDKDKGPTPSSYYNSRTGLSWYNGGDGGANAADGQTKQTSKDYKYAATMVVAIVTVGQGAAMVAGGGTLLSLEGASLGLDFALNADGIIDYSSNFNETGKKLFQTLNILKANGNIISQVKKGHMRGGIEFFDTAGNALGTITIVDNVLQLDGNKSLFEMIKNAQKNESEK